MVVGSYRALIANMKLNAKGDQKYWGGLEPNMLPWEYNC